jgi:hypothetical protein
MKTAACLLSATLLACTCRAGIDWTFHPSVQGTDGPTAPYVDSMVGGSEITYVPPVKWVVSGSQFLPPGKREADAYIEAYSIKAALPWTPDRAKALEAAALSRLPRGATNVKIDSEGVASLQVAGEISYEVRFSYIYFGQTFVESVLYAEHGTVQLRFHFGCLKSDFDALHAAFIGSLFSVRGF